MQEAVISEMRAKRLDLYSRTKFVKGGTEIIDARAMLDDLLCPEDAFKRDISTQVEKSAATLAAAAASDQFDVG